MNLVKKVTGITLIAFLIVMGTSTLTSCKKKGCTDSTAINYDADADEDDGTCQYNCGCTDSIANNYDPTATCDDGTCTYDPADCGCTDPNANNYDADAPCENNTICTYDRDKFIGTFEVSENCTSGSYNYTLTIAASSANTVSITLTNLGNFDNIVLNATVNGNTLTIASQTVTVQGTDITFSGTGTMNNTTVLNISYTATYGGNNDVCTATCLKQ